MDQSKACQLNSFLCCPCHLRSELEYSDEGQLKCVNEGCPKTERCFPQVAEQPVLIDFTESLFNEEEFVQEEDTSGINRNPSSFRLFVGKILWGRNYKCEANVKRFTEHLLKHNPRPTVLIVGGGSIGKGSDYLYTNPAIKVRSFDVYSSEVTDFVADAHSIPMKNESVDGVLIQAVLEHVLEPAKVVSEIYRVLKPNGIVYAETPFMQQVHEKAYDFTRFSESGHRWLFKKFELIDSGSVFGPATVLSWSLRYFFAGILRNKTLGAALAGCFFWLRYLDRFIPANYTSDGASAVFFLGIKSNQPMEYEEIVKFYRGVA